MLQIPSKSLVAVPFVSSLPRLYASRWYECGKVSHVSSLKCVLSSSLAVAVSCRCVRRAARTAPQCSKPQLLKTVCFENETTHGLDIGGHQDIPCITWPTCLSWPVRHVMRMTLLHMALTLLNDCMPICTTLQSSVA